MLKNIKKYIPKRKYRERSQNERRKKLGFLEKKQDYKVRAEDYHNKEQKYKKLKEAARTKNPDEFYHKMLKAKIIDGEHVKFGEEKTIQDKIVSNTQFINLVNFKKSMLEKEAEKMKYDLQMNAKEILGGKKHKHILFYDEDEDHNKIENEINELTNKKRQREHSINEYEEENANDNIINREKIAIYKQKMNNVNQLTAISKGLQEQKELIPNEKRYKDKSGNYKNDIERKK